jgi:hypothetical protein
MTLWTMSTADRYHCPRDQGPPSAEAGRSGVALCRAGGVRGRVAALRAHVVAPNGQRFRVWSTPKDADVAARMIRRFVLSNREG